MMWESHGAESILGSEMEGEMLSTVGLSWGRGVGTDGVGEGVKSHSTGSRVSRALREWGTRSGFGLSAKSTVLCPTAAAGSRQAWRRVGTAQPAE